MCIRDSPDVATVRCALIGLADSMNRADVQRGVEVGRSKESKASALHIEGRLNERIDEVEAICPASSLERSLESELGSLTRACTPAKRDVERAAKLHVCFR